MVKEWKARYEILNRLDLEEARNRTVAEFGELLEDDSVSARLKALIK